MSESRKHHYISQGYLRGFVSMKGKKKKLWVLDFNNTSQFFTNPANVAAKRDHNRVEIEGVDPNIFEKSFAEFEDDAIRAIRKLEESLDFSGVTQNYLINLIAFYYSRTPRLRERFRNLHEDLSQILLETTLATPERWKSVEEQFRNDCPDVYVEITHEEMLEFAKKKNKLSLRTEYKIEIELRCIDNLVTLLAHRNWVLVQATKESGPFITSDNPVFIYYRNPEEVPPLFRNNPGFGSNGTVVLFPITQNLLLSGEFDGPSGLAGASKETTAQMNSAAIRSADRQIYAPSENFVYLDKDYEIRSGAFLHQYLRTKDLR